MPPLASGKGTLDDGWLTSWRPAGPPGAVPFIQARFVAEYYHFNSILGHQSFVGEPQILVPLGGDYMEPLIRPVLLFDMAPDCLSANEYIELALQEVLLLVKKEVGFVEEKLEEGLLSSLLANCIGNRSNKIIPLPPQESTL
jgi:hypothetical protein